MIRNKTKVEINETLDEHKYFSSSDFEISTKGNSITIKYEYNEQFYFKINLPSRTTSKTVKRTKPPGILGTRSYSEEEEIETYFVTGKICPGEMVLEEDLRFEGQNEILRQISKWLNSLWEELVATPTNKLIEEQNEIIDKIKKQVNKIPEDYFTKEEAEELKKKIITLEENLKSQIESQANENDNLKQKLKELENEMDSLRATIPLLNKRNWFKSSMTKIYKWISKESNRKLLKDGVKLIKPLLPEPIKDVLD